MQNSKDMLNEINENLHIDIKKYNEIEIDNNLDLIGSTFNEKDLKEKEFSKSYGGKDNMGFSFLKGNMNNNMMLSSTSPNSSYLLNTGGNSNQFQVQYDKVIGMITDIEKRINKDFEGIEKMIENILVDEVQEDKKYTMIN